VRLAGELTHDRFARPACSAEIRPTGCSHLLRIAQPAPQIAGSTCGLCDATHIRWRRSGASDGPRLRHLSVLQRSDFPYVIGRLGSTRCHSSES
jgi:hypothetical protein